MLVWFHYPNMHSKILKFKWSSLIFWSYQSVRPFKHHYLNSLDRKETVCVTHAALCILWGLCRFSWPLLTLLCAVIISDSDSYTSVKTPKTTMSAVKGAALHIKQKVGNNSFPFSPSDVPANESMWAFKKKWKWAGIHDALITLSLVKLKLYIQSIAFTVPL